MRTRGGPFALGPWLLAMLALAALPWCAECPGDRTARRNLELVGLHDIAIAPASPLDCPTGYAWYARAFAGTTEFGEKITGKACCAAVGGCTVRFVWPEH